MTESLPLRGTGLLGGTFDPVHNGHLALAHEALTALRLARIEFLLAPRPWQKHVITSVTDRAAMLRLALAGDPRLRLNLTEVCREGLTYTIDTLRILRRERGPAEPLVLILGTDQWSNLTTWKDWEELIRFANLAVFNRGTNSGAAEAALPERQLAWSRGKITDCRLITARPAGAIAFFHMHPHEARSSTIRLFLRKPAAQEAALLEKWLPADVARYIHQQRLYAAEH